MRKLGPILNEIELQNQGLHISIGKMCERGNYNVETKRSESAQPFFSKSCVWLIAQIRSVGCTRHNCILFPPSHEWEQNWVLSLENARTTLFLNGPRVASPISYMRKSESFLRELRHWSCADARLRMRKLDHAHHHHLHIPLKDYVQLCFLGDHERKLWMSVGIDG